MWGQRGRESKAGDPHPEKWGGAGRGLKRDKERQRQGTNQGKAGRGPEVGELGSFVGFQGDPKGSRRFQCVGGTPKEGKNPEEMRAKRRQDPRDLGVQMEGLPKDMREAQRGALGGCGRCSERPPKMWGRSEREAPRDERSALRAPEMGNEGGAARQREGRDKETASRGETKRAERGDRLRAGG